MTLPDDKQRGTPRDRFRNILSADNDDQPRPERRKPAVVNLPKLGTMHEEETLDPGAPQQSMGGRAGSPASSRLLPTFWAVGAALSILANLILLWLLISTGRGLGAFNPAGQGALLAAYGSLEQMDKAHIRATIPIQTDIALDASVPVRSSTNITLARDVHIQGAHVTINTALVTIDAPASVVLPAGTSLDVDLDMMLPVKSSMPIAVDVPVDIAVSDTDLHGAIQSLQDALRPLVCASSPGAILPDGTPVCH